MKRFHPDANGGDRSFEERLRDIIKAHDTLEDRRTLLSTSESRDLARHAIGVTLRRAEPKFAVTQSLRGARLRPNTPDQPSDRAEIARSPRGLYEHPAPQALRSIHERLHACHVRDTDSPART